MANRQEDRSRWATDIGTACALIVFLLLAPDASAQEKGDRSSPPDELPPVRLESELVMVPVTVTDPYDRFVTGLRKGDFKIFDDKIEQDIAFFAEEDAPVTIGIVFDLSGSMKTGQKTHHARLALKRFIDTSHPDDEFFLIAFNQRAKLLQDFTSSADQIVNRLTLRNPGGRTALYDACYLALEKVAHGRHTRRALLIISDGMDNSSRYAYRHLRELVKERDVQIYAIGLFTGYGGYIIEEITSLTGGRAFAPMSAFELSDVVTRIALELRHQYSLGFYPTNAMLDGNWRRIRLKVRPIPGLPRIHVRGREGYYAKK